MSTPAGRSRCISASIVFGDACKNVDQPLVRPHLEVLARLLVVVGRALHAEAIDLRRKRHGAADEGAGALCRLDDALRRLIQDLVIIRLEAYANHLLRHYFLLFSYSATAVTTPAPTVRPPSRIAKRRPSSHAIGVMSSTSI